MLRSGPEGAPSGTEELSDAVRALQRQGRTEKTPALGSAQVIIFMRPPQPFPVVLHLRASDLPFWVGSSITCLNKPLTCESKRRGVHKSHGGETSVSPQRYWWRGKPLAQGWAGQHRLRRARHTARVVSAYSAQKRSQAELLNSLI